MKSSKTTNQEALTRRIKFKNGRIAEDPRGLQVTWKINGRTYLADVVGAYFLSDRSPGKLPGVYLKCRHFNGENVAHDVSASHVSVLLRTDPVIPNRLTPEIHVWRACAAAELAKIEAAEEPSDDGGLS